MITGLSPTAALVFLPFAIAIGVWVAWSDMKFMKIPNKAVLALGLVFLILGLLLLPFKAYLWALGVGAMVLVAGFIANQINLMGAGDAKFAAVMAPFFAFGDIRFILGLYAACLLGAFASHRLARLIPPIRRATEDWASWTHKDFPMGLALAGTLIFFLLAALKPLF
ncbi:prepilin peptidase [Fuscibacter oryzae]|uniref:Prepilin peptidase n=1 Tax=Fuscibacter oryzae TaxID=2803939 RepID=A0A8J7MSH0_9RHOB|nr:prepilin peptidase [Fuscibacter oryzae]MBL4928822.1 prepilin peptidase [Fuscibacter oryzae]